MFSSPLLKPERSLLPPRLRSWIGARLSGPPKGPRKRQYKAAIYHLDRLGDAVLAISTIRTLRNHFGAEDCVLIVSETEAPLLAMEFPDLAMVIFSTGAPGILRDVIPLWLRERTRLRDIFAEQTFCLSHNRNLYKELVLSWIHTDHVHRLDRHTYPKTFRNRWCYELEGHLQLLETALQRDVSDDEITPAFSTTSPHDGDELLVCPRSSESVREVSDQVLLAALRLWRKTSRAKIAFCGTRDQAPGLQTLAESVNRDEPGSSRVLLPQSIPALVSEIARAGAVVGVDSAPAHIATALDKRTVVIGGGGTFGMCFPWQRSHRQELVANQIPCYGCGWHCNQTEVSCLTGITAEQIAQKIPAL